MLRSKHFSCTLYYNCRIFVSIFKHGLSQLSAYDLMVCVVRVDITETWSMVSHGWKALNFPGVLPLYFFYSSLCHAFYTSHISVLRVTLSRLCLIRRLLRARSLCLPPSSHRLYFNRSLLFPPYIYRCIHSILPHYSIIL